MDKKEITGDQASIMQSTGQKTLIKKIFDVSPARLWDFLSNPTMIPVWFAAPRTKSIPEIVKILFPDANKNEAEEYRRNFLNNHVFFESLNEKLVTRRGRRTNCEGWPELLYVLVRILRPSIAVETGIFDGFSSAAILQAMHDNNHGVLYSIDLPARNTIHSSTHRMRETTLPDGCDPGWVVPDYLRGRFNVLTGDSKKLLPKVLKEQKQIDLFLHDSLHTFDHQWFEYQEAWPYLRSGGLLLSDDIFWNRAFHNFSKEKHVPYNVFHGFGVLKKP